MKKLSLDLDALAVDSFETGAPRPLHGTVRGHAIVAPQPTPPEYEACTCYASCLCPTNAYYCATVRATVISCDYTYNGSCAYDTYTTCGNQSLDICIDTETC
jgi:hypothetical protein